MKETVFHSALATKYMAEVLFPVRIPGIFLFIAPRFAQLPINRFGEILSPDIKAYTYLPIPTYLPT
jgi:hypothetical protein